VASCEFGIAVSSLRSRPADQLAALNVENDRAKQDHTSERTALLPVKAIAEASLNSRDGPSLADRADPRRQFIDGHINN
jgi:hypothetical protein